MKINSLIKIGLSNILIIGLIGCGEATIEDAEDTTSSTMIENVDDTTYPVNQGDTNQNTSPFLKVKEVYDGETLSVGTFSGNDINYYKLEMPKAGNLVTDSTKNIYLYDKDLNPLNLLYSHTNSINGTISLNTGSYIIKFNHDRGNYKKTFTLNSNVLFNQNNLPKISKGKHIGSGIQYYLIEITKAGNLVSDSTKNIYLYDKDLNPLNLLYSHTNSINGTISLNTGSYIIKFNHDRGNYKKTFTLNSNVLK